MRLTDEQIRVIRDAVVDLAGETARVRLFGSRVDDQARGGDIDLLLELAQPVDSPVWLAAQVGGRISRRLGGRKVDVVFCAPGWPEDEIHRFARERGVLL
jgi:predicted nucleotidyltransferase